MKNTIKIMFVVAFAMVVGYNIYKSQSTVTNMSEMALVNVNALALGESNDEYKILPCPDSPWNECVKCSQDRPTCSSQSICP